MSAAKAWTADEINTVVGLYLAMRVLVEHGEKFNKRRLIRRAQMSGDEALGYRSRGSIEMKLMNVTAVLHDIGRDDLSMADHGYRPLDSYQGALRERVAALVDGVTFDGVQTLIMQAGS